MCSVWLVLNFDVVIIESWMFDGWNWNLIVWFRFFEFISWAICGLVSSWIRIGYRWSEVICWTMLVSVHFFWKKKPNIRASCKFYWWCWGRSNIAYITYHNDDEQEKIIITTLYAKQRLFNTEKNFTSVHVV